MSSSSPISVKEFLFYLFVMGLIVIVLSSTVGASLQRLEVKTVDPNSLIEVQGALDFEEVLPGHSYIRELTVSLNLSEGMLRGLMSENVTVFVSVASDANNSILFFDVNGVELRRAGFELVCLLSQGECSRASPLSRVVKVRLQAPLDGREFNETVIVNATLVPPSSSSPFSQSRDVLLNTLEAQRQLGELRTRASELNLSEQLDRQIQEIESLISQAGQSAQEVDLAAAKRALSAAQAELQSLNQTTSEEQRSRVSGNILQNFSFSQQTVELLLLVLGLFVVYLIYSKHSEQKGKGFDFDRIARNAERER